MSVVQESKYIAKDIYDEVKNKFNITFYQFTFVFVSITIFMVYSLYTIAIIRINIPIITVVMTSTLFLFTMYQIYFGMRGLNLCDNILKKDKEMLISINKMLDKIKGSHTR